MRTVQDCINQLLDDGIIEEVLGRIMSGKEAEVFAALYRGHPCAVKVFKPRNQRNFKNNAQYLEGRNQIRDTRTKRAMEKGSSFGRAQSESSWKDMEHDSLQLASVAGVRVPKPIFMYEEALLMDLVVDAEGMPAPRMSDCQFTAEEAMTLHVDLFEQVKRLLGVHRIHGDLSAFNILMGVEGPTIIDMPQVIDAAANPQAETFLVRDWKNVVDYLGRFAPSINRYAFAGKALYRHYKSGTLEQALATEITEDYHRHGKRSERVGQGPEGVPHPGGPQRNVTADGRVEVVMGGGGGRNNRFTRMGGGGGGRGRNRGRQDGAREGNGAAPREPQAQAGLVAAPAGGAARQPQRQGGGGAPQRAPQQQRGDGGAPRQQQQGAGGGTPQRGPQQGRGDGGAARQQQQPGSPQRGPQQGRADGGAPRPPQQQRGGGGAGGGGGGGRPARQQQPQGGGGGGGGPQRPQQGGRPRP